MDTNKSTKITIEGNIMKWKSNFKRVKTHFWKRYFNKRVRKIDIIVE